MHTSFRTRPAARRGVAGALGVGVLTGALGCGSTWPTAAPLSPSEVARANDLVNGRTAEITVGERPTGGQWTVQRRIQGADLVFKASEITFIALPDERPEILPLEVVRSVSAEPPSSRRVVAPFFGAVAGGLLGGLIGLLSRDATTSSIGPGIAGAALGVAAGAAIGIGYGFGRSDIEFH